MSRPRPIGSRTYANVTESPAPDKPSILDRPIAASAVTCLQIALDHQPNQIARYAERVELQAMEVHKTEVFM